MTEVRRIEVAKNVGGVNDLRLVFISQGVVLLVIYEFEFVELVIVVVLCLRDQVGLRQITIVFGDVIIGICAPDFDGLDLFHNLYLLSNIVGRTKACSVGSITEIGQLLLVVLVLDLLVELLLLLVIALLDRGNILSRHLREVLLRHLASSEICSRTSDYRPRQENGCVLQVVVHQFSLRIRSLASTP